jgi:hypothetical protein
VLLQKLIIAQLVKKFPACNGTRRFISVFIKTHHCSLFRARLIQSTSLHTICLMSVFVIFSHLLVGLPSGFFPLSFPAEIFYTFLHSPIRDTCPPPLHISLLEFIILITSGEQYKLWSSSLCSFLHRHIAYTVLGSNILVSAWSAKSRPLHCLVLLFYCSSCLKEILTKP